MNSDLRNLLQTYTDAGLMAKIDQLVIRSSCNFEQDIYPLWIQVDQRIPGPGLQYAFWQEGQLVGYPFSAEFERIVRPLRYVVYSVHNIGTSYLSTRDIVQDIGAHLEGCVKDLHGVTQYNQTISIRTCPGFLPLGALVKNPWVRKKLGGPLCRTITQFCRLAWNPSKHDFTNNGSPDPMISFADAVCSYFLARAIGAEVLRLAGRLERVVQEVKNERSRYPEFIPTSPALLRRP